MMAAKPISEERNATSFVCLGRIYPEKRIEAIIDIMKGVRRLGHDVKLHIIGDTQETTYGRNLGNLWRAESGWIIQEGRQLGDRKAELLGNSAYGIHARPGEAFGIAVAEMITAGCIPFVPSQGGPAEIVDHHPALVYRNADEAINKIADMLGDRGLQAQVRKFIAKRAKQFSRDIFTHAMRKVVQEFIGQHN
jgi:glycosyltransferase involved in cell wall biosynthesis